MLPDVLVLVLSLATTKESLSIYGATTSRCLLTDIRLLRLLGGMISIINLYNDAAAGSFTVKTAIYEDSPRKGLRICVISQTQLADPFIYRFWEALSGICSRTIPHPDSQVNRLCISPDKRFLAAAGHHTVKLYDIRSTNPAAVLTFEGHTGNITGVAFHCEGKWMVTSSEDGQANFDPIRIHILTSLQEPSRSGTLEVATSSGTTPTAYLSTMSSFIQTKESSFPATAAEM
jgi:WD40 repeat protein